MNHYCKDCADKLDLPKNSRKEEAKCEVCGLYAYCYTANLNEMTINWLSWQT